MVKTPRTRHSKTEREPVTIELGPEEVSRVAAESDTAGDGVKEDIGASEAIPEETGETKTDSPAAETVSTDMPEQDAVFAGEPEPDPNQTVSDEPEERPRPDSPAAAPPRLSRGTALGAGLAGGIVVLVAAGLLQYAGVFGVPGGTGGEPAVPASVETDIATMKSEIDTLKSGQGAATDISGVTDQVDGLSQALDQVRTDVASLRQTVEAGGAGATADLEPLNARIAEIENRIAAIGPGPDAATPEEIAAINERIAGVEALAKAATDAGSAAESRFGAVEQNIAALTAKVDAQAGQPKIALAIAASALNAAIERGSPFEPEIETFAAIAPDAPGLADLRGFAERGVATRADILAEVDGAAKAMIAADKPPSGDAGFFERLLSSAESMVTVRPIGSVEGPGVPETVARMEVALQAGDLAKAIAEFDTLPDRAKAAGAPFADRIRARIAVEQLADQAIAAAMQAQ